MNSNVQVAIVAGSFDDNGGKSSGWARKLYREIYFNNPTFSVWTLNGGTWNDLQNAFNSISNYDIVLWFADVPNDKPKLIQQLKIKYPKVILITSKRNLDNEYHFQDLVSRALLTKSNLLMEFTGSKDKVLSTILDPLGNIFLNKSSDISLVAKTLMDRSLFLSKIKRVSSKCIGESIIAESSDEILEFIDIVKEQAETFHLLIHGVSSERMLGNASFRCTNGFPSFKDDNCIFVSRRNIDKRDIGIESFVATKQGDNCVEYFGSNKPSVDTPIQLKLYDMYPNVKFMLHSHTFIDGAPFTSDVIPCGAIEEAEQIWSVCPDSSMVNFSVNIKGHGSICLVDNPKLLKSIKWISRSIPTFEVVMQ